MAELKKIIYYEKTRDGRYVQNGISGPVDPAPYEENAVTGDFLLVSAGYENPPELEGKKLIVYIDPEAGTLTPAYVNLAFDELPAKTQVGVLKAENAALQSELTDLQLALVELFEGGLSNG